MDFSEKLRQIVGKLCDVDPDVINADYSFRKAGLHGSAKRAALVAAIRQHLDKNCPRAIFVKTFGELEAVVAGKSVPEQTSIDVEEFELDVLDNVRDWPKRRFDGTDGLFSCGIDVEFVESMPETDDFWEHEFYRSAFTSDEIAYCVLQENPRVHFAGRWCAKESLKKCDSSFLNEPMNSIEVVRQDNGGIFFKHHGHCFVHVH